MPEYDELVPGSTEIEFTNPDRQAQVLVGIFQGMSVDRQTGFLQLHLQTTEGADMTFRAFEIRSIHQVTN